MRKPVRVENGKITAAGSGKATVTAALKDGGSEKLKASVTVNTKVTKIRLEDKTIRLALGETYRLKPEVRPKDAYDPSLSYESSKPSVVSVNRKGLLRAKKKGTARITIESRDGGARVQVKVIVGDYPSSIRLSGVPRKMAVKDKVRLQTAVLPQGTKYTGVRWSSSDRTIAAVNKNGVVTAKKPGKATITCQARFGATAKKSVTITVVPEAPAYRAMGRKERTHAEDQACKRGSPVYGLPFHKTRQGIQEGRGHEGKNLYHRRLEKRKNLLCQGQGSRKGRTTSPCGRIWKRKESKGEIEMIFDSHAHYDDEAFDTDRQELLSSMEGAGIGKIVNVGASVEGVKATVKLTEQYPFLYGAVGIHTRPCRRAG